MARSPACIGLLWLPLLLACGGEEEASPRDSYEAVYTAAMQAVADADLPALWPLLTDNGRQGLERMLRAWQKQLVDPEEGRFLQQQIRDRGGSVAPGAVELAAYGTLEDAWRFLLRADPRPARPPRRAPRVFADGRTVVIDYQFPERTWRSVRLVLSPVGWYVDELQL